MTASVHAGIETGVEAEIRALEEAWYQAVLVRDVQAAERILADSYFLAVGVECQPLLVYSRAQWLAWLPEYRIRSSSLDDIRVHVYGDTAVAILLWRQDAQASGERDISGSFLLTDIWIKTPAGWRVAERHSSRQEKAPAQ